MRMLAKVLEEHAEKTEEFVNKWKNEKIDKIDSGGQFGHKKIELDFEKLLEFRQKLDEQVQLKEIWKRYPEM